MMRRNRSELELEVVQNLFESNGLVKHRHSRAGGNPVEYGCFFFLDSRLRGNDGK